MLTNDKPSINGTSSNRITTFSEGAPTDFHPMWGIPSQLPNRGSITTSHTATSRSGQAECLTRLVQGIADRVAQRRIDAAFLSAVDGLRPDHLVARAVTAFKASLDRDDDGNQLELQDRTAFLLDFAAGKVDSEELRTGRRVILNEIAHLIESFKNDLRKGFEENPVEALEGLGECAALVAQFKKPSPVALDEAIATVRRMQATLAQLIEAKQKITAELFSLAKPAVEGEIRRLLDIVLQNAIARLAAQEMQNRHIPSLDVLLKELSKNSVQFRERWTQTIDFLVENEKLVRQLDDEMTSAVAVVVGGPSADELLVGMKAKGGHGDTQELFAYIEEQFESRLRQRLMGVHSELNHGCPLVSMVLLASTDLLVELAESLMVEHCSDDHSLYQRIEAFGVDKCVMTLYERAATTCFHHADETALLGLSVDERAVVDLPAAQTADDERIRERLRRGFELRCPSVHFSNDSAEASLDEIRVTRVLQGLIIGVEAGNAAAMQRMVDASSDGHPPFLVGHVPGCETGEVSDAFFLLTEGVLADNSTTGSQE